MAQMEAVAGFRKLGRFFVIKPSALGSTEFLKHCLSKIGSRCILSSSFETSIGLAACLELASSLNGNSFALGFDTQAIFR